MLSCGFVSAQSGPWSGKLVVGGGSLSIVFHFDEEGCTLDSPDQGAKGIPAEAELSPYGKVMVKIPSLGASFEGFNMITKIVGTFKQGGVELPLTLSPGLPVLNRPQTPVGPFPYNTEEVSFANGSAVLKGTLTTPAVCSKDTPVVILVTGSGLQNRDEEIYGHKPFAIIADAFARAGIATLRYDDRGFGESTGDPVNCTTEDLMHDALAGIELLRSRFSRVGVAGHSEGGSIAFMLAAEQKVDFVISLAGAIISAKVTLVQQNEDAIRSLGYSDEVVKEYVAAISAAFDAIVAGEKPAGVEYSSLPPELKRNYDLAVVQSSTQYFRYFLSMDISRLLDKVHCPVLALNGSLDSQVDCAANLGALRDALPSSQASIVEVDGVNHLFQHCKSGASSEYKEIEESFAPEVLGIMVEWVRGL